MTEGVNTGIAAGADEPPPISTPDNDAWYYTTGGLRHGPVSAATIKSLLAKKEIDSDTQVWRKGMTDWVALKVSELGPTLATEPPPIAGDQVNNVIVWVIAFLPLVVGIYDASVAQDNARNLLFGVPGPDGGPLQEAPLSWVVLVAANTILCIIDAQLLKRAGYDANRLGAGIFGALLVPVYLFVRAKRLRQRPWYGFVWIAMLLLGAALPGLS